MEVFKCRASASGLLATNPRSKSETLSQTTKTYLHEWMTEQIYGYKKQIDNKYISKGLEFEDMAIDKVIEWLDLPFAIKNPKRFEDEFFTGEPDLLLADTVVDIKNSWDCFTFPRFEDEIPTKGYETQLQVYMHLTGLKKAKLVYVLLNTPETKWTEEMTYEHVDKSDRIKCYDLVYDEAIIYKLTERVKQSRIYINLKLK